VADDHGRHRFLAASTKPPSDRRAPVCPRSPAELEVFAPPLGDSRGTSLARALGSIISPPMVAPLVPIYSFAGRRPAESPTRSLAEAHFFVQVGASAIVAVRCAERDHAFFAACGAGPPSTLGVVPARRASNNRQRAARFHGEAPVGLPQSILHVPVGRPLRCLRPTPPGGAPGEHRLGRKRRRSRSTRSLSWLVFLPPAVWHHGKARCAGVTNGIASRMKRVGGRKTPCQGVPACR